MKFPTYEEMGKEIAEKALDEYLYKGKTLREWVEIISAEEKQTNTTECNRNICLRNEYNGISCDECEVNKTNTAECFTIEELESWLWQNVLNNSDNTYGESVETLIGRLDGFKRFVEDSRMKGENQ